MRPLIFLAILIAINIILALYVTPWWFLAHAQVGYTNVPDPCQIQPNDVPVLQGGGGGGYPVFDAAVASNTANILDQSAAIQTNTDSLNQLAQNKCYLEEWARHQNEITGSVHSQIDNGVDAGNESQIPGAQ